MKMKDSDDLAVLIDGDNISSKHIAGLMAEIANYGTASVRRIYGDWTSPMMKGWRECLLEHSITPIQQFAYTQGKNATDGAMIIDAMDLLYTGRFAAFCLVTSDSDFTRLASRIREQGIKVYGFGNRHNTHKAFIAACNEFVYLDALPMPQEEGVSVVMTGSPMRTTTNHETTQPVITQDLPIRPPPTGPKNKFPPYSVRPAPAQDAPPVGAARPLNHAALANLRKAINSSSIYEGDFANLAEVGAYLTKIAPDLNARNYGFLRLKDFVVASGIVEVKMKPRGDAPPIAMVRLKE